MIIHEHWLLTPQRAAVHVLTQTAVLADLHLGYSEARQKAGDAVPRSDILQPFHGLERSWKNLAISGLILAGDLFEEEASLSLLDPILCWLDQTKVKLLAVIPGNHDRGLDKQSLPLFPDGFDLDGWRIMHGHGDLPTGSLVIGHHHPSLKISGRRHPCFLVGPQRLVLPAFSPDAAGVNVRREKCWKGFRAFPIVRGRLLNPVAL